MTIPVVSTPSSEINARIAKLQAALQQDGIDGALILQNTDLFYFSGTIQQAHLYVPATGDPLLMVRKSLVRARDESPLASVVALKSPRQLPELIQAHGLKPPNVLGIEMDVLPANNYFIYQKLFPETKMRDISLPIRMIRAVKSDHEQALIRQAADFSDQVAQAVPGLLRPGMTEIELAGMVEAHARRLGHQGIVRMRLFGAGDFLLLGAHL